MGGRIRPQLGMSLGRADELLVWLSVLGEFFARRCATTGGEMAELQSLSITAASGRISCICCSRGSHMEIWRIMSSGFVSGSLVFVVVGVASRVRKIGTSWR